jgi:histidine triad (HIT) family protein
MSNKTLFEKILDGEIPGEIVYQDAQCAALRDINPQAPVHLLIIPRKPIASVDALQPEDSAILGHLWGVIPKLAQQFGLVNGYRVVVNCGPEAGQTVDHLHFHLLGGRPMRWPPG